MSLPQLVLKNQFGEESVNEIISSTGGEVPAAAVADGTIIANFSGGSAFPIAKTTLQVANKLPAKTGITAISAEAAATAITIALSTSGGNTYSDAAVNTAVNAALVTVVTDINAAITQINAILAAMKVVS